MRAVEVGSCTISRQYIRMPSALTGTVSQKLSSSRGGWKPPTTISFACGTAVPTPLTPEIQTPVESSLTIVSVARSGGTSVSAVPDARAW